VGIRVNGVVEDEVGEGEQRWGGEWRSVNVGWCLYGRVSFNFATHRATLTVDITRLVETRGVDTHR
jgi:hypothetical protein